MTPEPTLRVRPDLHEEEVDGDVVVLEPDSGVLHVLTGTAKVAWAALRDGRTRAALVDEVTAAYGMGDEASARADVAAFVDDLSRRGLVVDA